MQEWKMIKPEEMEGNPFTLIGREWILLTATDSHGNSNPMTASWGGMGVLWGKPVCFFFVRPQRHTHQFSQDGRFATLSFFEEEHRKMLQYMGRQSGRDGDKAAACHLTPARDGNGAVFYEEARLVISTQKLYCDVIRPECFVDQSMLEHYPAKDYHTVYVAEITEIRTR